MTGFFRDPPAWEYLATEIVPQLMLSCAPEAPLRIWSAGCASGEEAYTVAMVLARVLGEEAFRDRVKIYATDIDEAALDQARQGAYAPRQIEDVPHDALDRFFERTDQRYVFRKDLRRCVIFGRNDLVQDAPISRVNLLVCRNTLMYFTAETQAQVLRRFQFALDDAGFLMLGKSEMLLTHADLFTPVEIRCRLFRPVPQRTLRDRIRSFAVGPANGGSQTVTTGLREAAFEIGGAAQIVLDAAASMVMANDAARTMFSLSIDDFGRPIQDLEVSYRPVELRSQLDQLATELRSVDIKGVHWRSGDQERILDVRLIPLVTDGALVGTSITYVDVTAANELNEQLNTSRRELEEAYEELQSTVEELETTNEELQSTNEELETTNEELQSTNEELETMNEELQSTNEELETMNDEFRHRSLEVNEINSFLETILTTIGLAVVVLDRRQHVRIWNGQAREMWGLTADEAEDQHLFALDFGLPVEKLRASIRASLAGGTDREEIVVEATNRRGKPFQCRVTLLPLGTPSNDGASGAIMMMESVGA